MVQCPYCKSQNVTQAKHDTSHTYKCFNCGNVFIYQHNINQIKHQNTSKNFTIAFCLIFIVVIYLTTCIPFFKGIIYRHNENMINYTANITNIELLENNWFKYQTKYYATIDIEFSDNDNNLCTYTFKNVKLNGGEKFVKHLQETNQIDILYDGNSIEIADNISWKNNISMFIFATCFSFLLILIPIISKK